MGRHQVTKQQTQEAIQQAFVLLLQTKNYEEITVREIAQQADIGFKTFYRHYSDKDEITQVLYNKLWSHFLQQISVVEDLVGSEQNIRVLLASVRENVSIMRAMIAIHPHVELVPDFARDFVQQQIRHLQPEYFSNDHDNKEQQAFLSLLTTYFISNQFELIRWWIESDFLLSEDVISSLIISLVVGPMMSLNLLDISQSVE